MIEYVVLLVRPMMGNYNFKYKVYKIIYISSRMSRNAIDAHVNCIKINDIDEKYQNSLICH